MAEKKAFPELRTYIEGGSGVSLGPVLLRHVVQHIDDQAAEIERLRGALLEIHGEFIHGSRKLYTTPDAALDSIRAAAANALGGAK